MTSLWAALQSIEWLKVFTVLGPFIGFLSGWGLFEVTERRKVRLAQRELRQALAAELEHAELLLSSIVGKYAFTATTPPEIKTCAAELRWFRRVGHSRAVEVGISSPEPTNEAAKQFDALDDKHLVALMVSITPKETLGTKLLLPVVDAVLAAKTAGFTSNQIQAISTVRWQAYLLEQDADWMKEFFRLSFTTDGDNREIVTINHDKRVHAYAFRAGVLLRCTREALKSLTPAQHLSAIS